MHTLHMDGARQVQLEFYGADRESTERCRDIFLAVVRRQRRQEKLDRQNLSRCQLIRQAMRVGRLEISANYVQKLCIKGAIY